jgi:hypothetical protein
MNDYFKKPSDERWKEHLEAQKILKKFKYGDDECLTSSNLSLRILSENGPTPLIINLVEDGHLSDIPPEILTPENLSIQGWDDENAFSTSIYKKQENFIPEEFWTTAVYEENSKTYPKNYCPLKV